ncbi:hypothetical protein BB561_003047 [Smittium simulii]|uniref:USP domain-containing protein n=1 Tax=Smittium simulii TaxID=133385 RepID=A0A2T9YN77_9FUNG|nr:hypothetical protein BB561_003047 [Smittium simulii]
METHSSKKIKLENDKYANEDAKDDLQNELNDAEINQNEPDKKLFLDTVNRSVLDFDFEKQCSVTLSSLNVYACLVCGRGKKTQAYFHSINQDHKVFINLNNLKAYILPENYEVFDNSFNDIKAVINPVFTSNQIADLDSKNIVGYDINRKQYRPGFIGLNNIKSNDYINVIIQLLAHVPPIRDMLLMLPNNFNNSSSNLSTERNKNTTLNQSDKKIFKQKQKNLVYDECTELVKRLSILVRKIWFPNAFKSHVSPHELIQEISNRSNKAFKLSAQGDSFELLTWLLNTLHYDFQGSKKKNSSTIYQAFRGTINTISQKLPDRNSTMEEKLKEFDSNNDSSSKVTPFLALGLDLPLPPLFRKEGDTLIPQVQLVTLLKKYNGTLTTLIELPNYIILHIKRFMKNDFIMDKNPTIVNFPIDNVAFGDLIQQKDDINGEKEPKSADHRLYNLLANIVFQGNSLANEQNDNSSSTNLQSGASNIFSKPKKTFVGPQSNVSLVTNIPSALKTKVLDMPGESIIDQKSFTIKPKPNEISDTNSINNNIASNATSATVFPISGQYSIHLRDKATNQWFSITDLTVEPIIPQMICLSESYIQVWEKQI